MTTEKNNVVPLRPKAKYPLDPLQIQYNYEQVLNHLQERIAAAEFKGRLPSREVLAEEYGVCAQTVSKAIKILAERGVVFALGTKGTYLT